MLLVIYKIYKTTKLNLSLNNILYNSIESNVGIKQGCTLSPILFSMLLDDLRPLLDQTKYGIQFQSIKE